MAQRNSLRPSGLVAGVLAALASMMHRGRRVDLQVGNTGKLGRFKGLAAAPPINWLKGSLMAGRTAPGARGG